MKRDGGLEAQSPATLTDARELARKAPQRALVPSPPEYAGTLDELFDRFIEPNLPSCRSVERFHEDLCRYVQMPDALLLVRQVRGTERRQESATADGTRLKATDNAPAWWVHYALLQGCHAAPGAFAHVVATMPAHLFEVARTMPTSASAAGWHIAHLFSVKDGQTDYQLWDRADAVARFIRNVHPCNYGLLPKADWQRWGADNRVLAYFCGRFAERYRSVWGEFLELGRANIGAIDLVKEPVPYAYGHVMPEDAATPNTAVPLEVPVESQPRASYRASRLLFRRDVIEPMADDDPFEIVTPHGTFVMTKEQFYTAFPNVCESVSYRERGVYHYAAVPKAALRFVVNTHR